MTTRTIWGIAIPFIGTAIGAAWVLLMKGEMGRRCECALTGFASGVMVAASVWSLLLPAIAAGENTLGKWAFIPAVVGVWGGVVFLLLLDGLIRRLQEKANTSAGESRSFLMVLAVTLHNLPEGMAVGVAFCGALVGDGSVAMGDAMALALGVAIQNFPEGAIVSMPLRNKGRGYALGVGVLSGIVEPMGALCTMALFLWVVPLLPYLLSFAAGAMLFVVVRELIPEIAKPHKTLCTLFFTLGFSLMMALDVALG